jgi:ubiquinone/menaquinone biosynthesis C-methylase UbiE
MVASDRRCYGGALDNPIRRIFLPPSRELRWLDLRSGQGVVDLGAGVGFFDIEILRHVGPAGHLVVVEPDGVNLGRARRRIGPEPRVEFWESSAASVPQIPSASIDRALLSLVICCMVDKEGALDETWRILKPGGRALVSYPRRRRPSGRRSALRVTPERWASLLARHSWETRPVASSWIVQRHLLEKPAAMGSERE